MIQMALKKNLTLRPLTLSLLHSRFLGCHAMAGGGGGGGGGALRNIPKNGCGGDYLTLLSGDKPSAHNDSALRFSVDGKHFEN